MTFDELAARRRQLQLFCYAHAASLQTFRSGISYKVTLQEKDLEGFRHLTSTATCIESLLKCPAKFRSSNCKPRKEAAEFARTSIERADEDWVSEESARIYCRCRGLPLTIQFLDSFDERIRTHVDRILAQLEEPDRFAIGEADPSLKREEWYPPNSFHTYWTLVLLHVFKIRFADEYKNYSQDRDLDRVQSTFRLWARRTLGQQIALHAAESSVLDTDQLAWALATLLRFDPNFPSGLADQDLLREALKRLFLTQLPVGTWRHYRSLFHYKKAGNAYCYIHETFAVLLGIAVNEKRDTKFFRDCLLVHNESLHRLWGYAESTKAHLRSPASEPNPIGWCSGHRLNQTLPESWATASVFAFAQAYRRLLGIWTRETAGTQLNVVKPRFDKTPDDKLKERGDSWIPPDTNTSLLELIYTLYINPIRSSKLRHASDPDEEILEQHQARSAILFGPPGASKTTLVRATALSVGWQYVEIHASHFVSDGMDRIQAKADEIFRRLMELDHTVILFDEIDELVREREGGQEAFGRFLTTSMLPKLAELWQQRKTLYFVATNHIQYFDRAITRSERFDALILVAPPSYRAKKNELKRLLDNDGKAHILNVTPTDIWSELEAIPEKQGTKGRLKRDTRMQVGLAKFVLLRYDQLKELAGHIRRLLKPGQLHVSKDLLRRALREVKDRNLAIETPYLEFLNDIEYRRQDADKYQVWRVQDVEGPEIQGQPIFRNARGTWLKIEDGSPLPPEIHGRLVHAIGPGVVQLSLRK